MNRHVTHVHPPSPPTMATMEKAARPKPKQGHSHTCTGTHKFTVTGVHRETTYMFVKWVEITALPAKGNAAHKFWVRPNWLMHKSGPMPTGDQALCMFKDGLAEPPCEPPCPALEGVTVTVQGERHNPWFKATATEFKEIQARVTASTRPRPPKRAAATASEPDSSVPAGRGGARPSSCSSSDSSDSSDSDEDDSDAEVCAQAGRPRPRACVGCAQRCAVRSHPQPRGLCNRCEPAPTVIRARAPRPCACHAPRPRVLDHVHPSLCSRATTRAPPPADPLT